MGKIVIKDNSADAANAKTSTGAKVSVDVKAEKKTEKIKTNQTVQKDQKGQKPKAKSSITPGSELVVAPVRAVAVVNKKKPVGAKSAGAGKKKPVKVGGGVADTEKVAASGAAAGLETKKTKKSVSGMVIDSTVVASGPKIKVDAKTVGYAVDDAEAGKDIKTEHTKAQDGETQKTKAGKPRFSKPKSALIGVGVALIVAIIGFIGIWFFSRKPTETCVVQFEPNGGSQVNAQSIMCGTLAKEPEAPTKDGFDFKGWAFEGLPFDFENDKVTKNIVLVAWWEEHPDTEVVRVSFDTAGGSAMESIKLKKGGILETITMTPTRSGYDFVGWYLGDQPFDHSQAIDEDITLTAHWKEKPQGSGTNSNAGNNGNSSGSGSGSNDSTVSVGICDPMIRGDIQGVTVEVGSTVRLSASLAYLSITNCNVSFRTNDAAKIEVSGNTLKGLVAGDARVAVCLSEVGGKEVECTEVPVKVTEKVVEPEVVPVTGVEIVEGAKTDLVVGETVQLYERVLPTNATDKTATWTSSGSAVVEVTSDGLMKAVGAGTATLTVTTKDGGKTATITITVKAKEEEPKPPVCQDDEVWDENSQACVKKPPEGGDETGGGGTEGTS